MDAPAYLPHDRFSAIRGERAVAEFAGLWTAGSLNGLARTSVAIVGTRAATAYGKGLAHSFASALAGAGCTILSGLALGIDAAAHEGALAAGGTTIGVLGSGHARFFPSRNRDLARRMVAAGGAVLSPFPPDERAYPASFLQRNGIVAALADAVVVIEAPARSGALNTAGWAAGRIPVFAVPGDVDRPHVAGCHALIRDGAILARGPQDVLDDLRLSIPSVRSTRAKAITPEDPVQRALVKSLQSGECALDTLLAAVDEPPHAVLAALSLLELEGAVEARPGQRYALRR